MVRRAAHRVRLLHPQGPRPLRDAAPEAALERDAGAAAPSGRTRHERSLEAARCGAIAACHARPVPCLSCCACFRSAISSSSRRSTSSSSAGFTVLTGETGAGKSILLDALSLLLGDRFEARQLRPGAERAELAAEFDLADAPACAHGSPSRTSPTTDRVAAAPRARRAGPQPRVDQRPAGHARATEGTSARSGRPARPARASVARPAPQTQRELVDAFGGFAALAREVARRVARVARRGRAARRAAATRAGDRRRARLARRAPARARQRSAPTAAEWQRCPQRNRASPTRRR